MLQYYPCMQYTVRQKIIHTQKGIYKHSEMGPVRQNPIPLSFTEILGRRKLGSLGYCVALFA